MSFHHNIEKCAEKSDQLEANVYSKELETNVDSYEMEINEINDHTEVIRNSQIFADDTNPLRTSFNNEKMQHEVPSQVNSDVYNPSSRTHRKMKTSDKMKLNKTYLIRKLRKRIYSLEKSLEKVTKLVGEDNISLFRKDKRMKVCMSSVKLMFEEEGKKNSELTAKANFLLNQVCLCYYF